MLLIRSHIFLLETSENVKTILAWTNKYSTKEKLRIVLCPRTLFSNFCALVKHDLAFQNVNKIRLNERLHLYYSSLIKSVYKLHFE